MINYNELKTGSQILLDNEPYQIIESAPMFKARGSSVLQTKIKNLKTGNVLSRTFKPSDSFEEPDLKKIRLKYIYSHRDKHVFCQKDDVSKRFKLEKEQVGNAIKFLKTNQDVEGLMFEQELTKISLPVKVKMTIKMSPPSVKGERAQSGTKVVTLENGTTINTPLFIKTGDIIEINTQTGEYVRRVN